MTLSATLQFCHRDLILYKLHENLIWNEVHLVSMTKLVIVPVIKHCISVSGSSWQ